MIELKQFLLWIMRKTFALPKRMHDSLTESLCRHDWFFPFAFSLLGVAGLGLGVGVVLHGIVKGTEYYRSGAIALLIIWSIGGLFVLSAGVRAMYYAFKAEQQEFIDRLKQ